MEKTANKSVPSECLIQLLHFTREIRNKVTPASITLTVLPRSVTIISAFCYHVHKPLEKQHCQQLFGALPDVAWSPCSKLSVLPHSPLHTHTIHNTQKSATAAGGSQAWCIGKCLTMPHWEISRGSISFQHRSEVITNNALRLLSQKSWKSIRI